MKNWAAIACALVAAATPFAACSDTTPAEPPDGGATDASRDERGPLLDSGSEDSDPVFNTEGWVRIDYPNCSFWASPSADKMPPPLQWDSCSSSLVPAGIVCRQIRGGSASAGWVDPSGKLWLVASVPVGNRSVDMVVEADGPVHQAITYGPGDCVFTSLQLVDNKVLYMAVRPKGQVAGEERGAIGGSFDGVPTALEHFADDKARGYRVGGNAYLSLPDNIVHSWTPGAPPLGTIMLTDPGQIWPTRFVGDELFYEVGNLAYSRIKVYSPSSGSRDLISFGNDVSANAADFGTDGIDMVWLEAFGRSSTSEPWTTINIMTSKFTPDAMNLQKRRLRSDRGGIGASPFTVGCGYAARFSSSLEEGNVLRVVRLSDGHSWRLTGVLGDAGYWIPQIARAITCEEIIVRVDDSGEPRTTRIRLDSLGPGEPAD